MPLRAAFSRMRATASAEMSTASTDVAARRQRQREAAVVAEGVEQAAARVAQRGLAVLALIEEQPGLLPLPRIHLVADGAFADLEALGHLAVEHLDRLLEPFEQADARIVARQDAGRAAAARPAPR